MAPTLIHADGREEIFVHFGAGGRHAPLVRGPLASLNMTFPGCPPIVRLLHLLTHAGHPMGEARFVFGIAPPFLIILRKNQLSFAPQTCQLQTHS